MLRNIKRVLIVANFGKPQTEALTDEMSRYFSASGIQARVFGFRGKPGTPDASGVDLAVSLGGDGTVLYSARSLTSYGIPILAVNLGNFGFITEVGRDEWQHAFEQYRAGELGISERLMISVRVIRDGRSVARFCGMNEAVVCAEGISKVVNLDVSVGETVLGRFKADGMIIATPTGSTAYSAAAGGPILDPEMEALILNPICPFTLSNRPLVVNASEPVEVHVLERQRTGVMLTVDGQETLLLEPSDYIVVERAPRKAFIVRSTLRNFFEVLREKLNWSGGADA